MEKQRLIDNGTKELVAIMRDLSQVNRRIAIVYNEIYGEEKEIEDDFDYIEAQRSIQAAIRQIGQILGNNLAEKFF